MARASRKIRAKNEDTATPKEEAKQGSFKLTDLTDQQQKDFKFTQARLLELVKGRENHYGHDLDTIWAEADRDYIPHRLKTKGSKRVIATDEEKGWRGSLVNLGSSDWQSDISQANVFVKVQIALSIMVDQNPSGTFTAVNRKYAATTELVKQLYERSWEYARSKPQLKLFIFNLAKYGWAAARTYPLRITRKVKVLTEYNQEDPENSKYEEKEVVEFNDIMRENLDPRNVWIDDMSKPNDSRTMRDWCFRKVYDIDTFKEEFGMYKRAKFVQAGGNTEEVITMTSGVNNAKDASTKTLQTKKLVEVFFYENRQKDLFEVIAGGVPVVMEPLPIADAKGIKKLSLWQTYWNLRHSQSPYGIGIYEAIRYDQAMLDKFRNMTIDQITMSIYKMFFYQGTNALSDTGDIKIQPGVGKQVLDPKNVNWLEVPGPGKDSYLGIDMLRRDVDEDSGITDPLLGQVTGKTAFEIAQAKESALKRMKNPLDNILEALNEEGYITTSLMQLLYSIPETYEIADPLLIEDYLKEIGGDQELFDRSPQMGEDGNPLMQTDAHGANVPVEKFTAKVYPEFPLNLDKDPQGTLVASKDTQFFRTKPSSLAWEGVINIKSQSLLSPSKQVDKAMELEMYNVLIPLMQSVGQEYAMKQQMGQPVNLDDLTNGKVIKNIAELYDKDPRDIIPDTWLKPPQMQQAPSLFLPANHPGATANPNPDFATAQTAETAPTVANLGATPTTAAGVSQKASAMATG